MERVALAAVLVSLAIPILARAVELKVRERERGTFPAAVS